MPAKGPTATKTMDGRKSCGNVLRVACCVTGYHRRGCGLGFLDEAHGGVVQIAQFRFARFIARELHKVAASEKFAKAFLLVRKQTIRRLQLVQEFLRGALGCAEGEPFFKIKSQRVRNECAEGFRLRNERQRFRQ